MRKGSSITPLPYTIKEFDNLAALPKYPSGIGGTNLDLPETLFVDEVAFSMPQFELSIQNLRGWEKIL